MKTPKKEGNFTTFSTLYPLPPSYHQNLLVFFQKNNPHKIQYHRPSIAAPYQSNIAKPTWLEAHSKPSPILLCEVDMYYQVTKRSINGFSIYQIGWRHHKRNRKTNTRNKQQTSLDHSLPIQHKEEKEISQKSKVTDAHKDSQTLTLSQGDDPKKYLF